MRNPIVTIAAAVVLTLLAVFVALNLLGAEKKIDQRIDRKYATHDAQFQRALSVLLGPPVLAGNYVQTLLNGDAIFPAMLAAIRGAQRTITFETYIYWSESIGQEFADALSERARAGVQVHVLLDWLGSLKMEERQLAQMREAGVQIERFHKPAWYHLTHMNNRTHRKLLVVDGRVGFTGGVGIADKWRGDAQDADHWRDTHYRVQGPVVAQMQAVFMDNWTKATGAVLHGDDYFPALAPAGTRAAQMFSSSPTGGSESMQLMYLLAIASASESIQLSSAYFVPDELTIQALVDAAKRGVKVRIITPNHLIDSKVVRGASRAVWGPLLEAGIQIAEFQPTMFHCKVLVVDGLLASVGSTNFDNRSFRLNDEANLNVLDQEFAMQQMATFERDWSRSSVVTLEQWRQRPLLEKAAEHASSLFSLQL